MNPYRRTPLKRLRSFLALGSVYRASLSSRVYTFFSTVLRSSLAATPRKSDAPKSDELYSGFASTNNMLVRIAPECFHVCVLFFLLAVVLW